MADEQESGGGVGMDRLGPYELNTIVTGDARELAKEIPDESVDLIFTDPVYQNIDDYRWLAETAARVLKPDKACLAFCGIGWKDLTIEAMKQGGLSYKWEFATLITGGQSSRFIPKGFAKWYSCLWFEKGESNPIETIVDALISSFDSSNGYHHWAKSPDNITHWLGRFVQPGDIVADFFCGGGTVPAVAKMLGVNYWACEIDPPTAARARERVAMTQPPLFTMPVIEQAAMFEGIS